jgi:rubrerythrin
MEGIGISYQGKGWKSKQTSKSKEGEEKMSKSEDNLWAAFAGESQANRKYLAFAEQADKEGYKQAAKLFRAAAAAETVHAHAHLRALKAVKGTAENLKEAINGETHEFKSMYPEMIAAAREEGATAAERSFSFANSVEQVHASLYQKALDSLEKPQDVDCYYVCSVCGYTCENEAPGVCPVCGAKSQAFSRID